MPTSHSRLGTGRPAWLAGVAVLGLASAAQAEPEVIADPERPGSGEVIADPERPSEAIADPERPAGEAATPSEQQSGAASWIHGSYRVRLFADVAVENTAEDVFLLQNRLELRGRHELGEHWRAQLSGRLEHWLWGESNPDGPDLLVNGRHYDGFVEATLRESALSGRFGGLYVELGNLSVVWGAGTLSQPAAVINPMDHRRGPLDDPVERRIPVPAADVVFTGGGFSIEAVLVPFFVPHAFDVRGTDFALVNPARRPSLLSYFESFFPALDDTLLPYVEDALAVSERPEVHPQNASVGARVASHHGGVDLGLGWFFGWDRTPLLETDNGGRVTSTYQRSHWLELDLVTYLGPLGVRLESVYTPSYTAYLAASPDRAPVITHPPGHDSDFRNAFPEGNRVPLWSTALALSYERSEHLALQVEGYWRHAFEAGEDATGLLLDADNVAILFNASIGLAEVAAWAETALARLSFRAKGSVGVTDPDGLVSASAVWSLSDAVDLGLGAEIYWGPPLQQDVTPGGAFDINDQAFGWVEGRF